MFSCPTLLTFSIIHIACVYVKCSPKILYTFEVYDFEGEPAVGVFYNGEQVGNIAKKDLPGVLPLMDRYAGLSDFAVTGGGDKCGLEIAVYFKKSA